MQRTLVVMVKEPKPGRVKTRLGRGIGMTTAAWWFRHQTKRLLRNVQDPRWQTVLAVSPDVAGLTSRVWPENLLRYPQGSGDLGARMARLIRSMPAGPVCIIGADIPEIGPTHIERAFKQLGASDAVFGPAPDGGFWLVGLKRARAVPMQFFEDVRWSTEYALSDSLKTLSGHRISFVDTLQDVDTVEDLAKLKGRDSRRV